MKISFIIIGRNEGERLVSTIESVYNFVESEALKDYEVIYVDSQSTDNSVYNAKRLGVGKIFLVEGECNAGIGRNIGAKEADGDILFFLDGDMQLLTGFWQNVINGEGRLSYPFVSGVENEYLYDNDWNYVRTQYRRRFIPGRKSYEITTGGLFCITKELWNKIGGIDSRLRINEDLDLGVRLNRIGFPLCRMPEIWVNHYTRIYGTRPISENGIKYRALFIRKHLYDIKLQIRMIDATYTYWLLLLSVVLAFILPVWIPALLLLSGWGYKVVRTVQRAGVKLNPFNVLFRQIRIDMLFWWNFIVFNPRMPELRYSRK